MRSIILILSVLVLAACGESKPPCIKKKCETKLIFYMIGGKVPTWQPREVCKCIERDTFSSN